MKKQNQSVKNRVATVAKFHNCPRAVARAFVTGNSQKWLAWWMKQLLQMKL